MTYFFKHYFPTPLLLGFIAGVIVFFGISAAVQAQLSTFPTALKKGAVERSIPQSGGAGQYLAIIGKGFGNGPGDVTFVQGGNAVKADVSLPSQCQKTWWRDSAIIVKVPGGAKQGQNRLKIKSANGEQIGEVFFTVTTARPTPGICGLDPDNGPAGVAATIYGERFGSKQGKVTFGTIPAEIAEGGWSESAIRLKSVPQFEGTSTTVRAITADNTLSSPSLFASGQCRANQCGEGASCCSDGSCRLSGQCQETRSACTYSWSFYTGQPA